MDRRSRHTSQAVRIAALLALLGPGAQALAQPSGLRDDGLPGHAQIGAARLSPAGTATLGGAMRYGFTEKLQGDSGVQHRLAVRLGGAYTPIEALALSIAMDGQYHAQGGGAQSGDGGFLARTRLAARGVHALSPRLRLGGELSLGLPAAAAPGDALSGLGIGLDALLGYAASDALELTASVGFRLDRSAQAIDDPERLSAADRAALDVADANAVPLGLAFAYDLGSLGVFGEWSWQPRVGARAQGAFESPMWLTGGVRVRVAPPLQWSASLSVSPSARPDLAAGPALQVVEPRLWIGTGLVLSLSPAPPPPAVTTVAPPAPPAPAPAPAAATLRGQVVRTDGVAVPGAHVRITAGEEVHETVADDAGRFELADVPPGTQQVEVSAEGFRPASQQVELVAGQPLEMPLSLERELPDGHIRGHVQNYRGRGVAATVRIDPLGTTLSTDAEGRFDVDVPPGEYSVAVEAPRYKPQERPAVVEQNGVTVLIIELKRGR